MELHNLKPAKGSVKKGKRIGRGEGSKRGGTATRGHKGQKSRSGYSKKIGFEGGQQPLQRRVPKFGFTNPNRVEYQGVNLDRLQELVDNKKIKTKVDKKTLDERWVSLVKTVSKFAKENDCVGMYTYSDLDYFAQMAERNRDLVNVITRYQFYFPLN